MLEKPMPPSWAALACAQSAGLQRGKNAFAGFGEELVLLGNGIGGFQRVEELLLVLLDAEDLKQFGRVLRDLAVIDDALKFAGPGIADFCLRNDLDRHPPPGDVQKIRQDTTCRLTENGAGKAAQEGSGKAGTRFLFGDRVNFLFFR